MENRREVGRLVGCSNKMIQNAINYKEKAETRGRKRVLTQHRVNRLVREIKKYPFKAATALKKGPKYNCNSTNSSHMSQRTLL